MSGQGTSSRLSVLGVVRDGGDELVASLARISELNERLDQMPVIIATNDNSDATDDVLREFAEKDSDRSIVSLDGLAAAIRVREDRIAAARNMTLAALAGLRAPPEYTLVLDLDGPNSSLDPEALLSFLLEKEERWDALFANQPNAYYDLFALRHPKWCPGDCWQEVSLARKRWVRFESGSRIKNRIVHARQYSIPADYNWIEVESAFGGLGLYRTAALTGKWYSARDAAGVVTCEHVVLHQQMRAAGARLFIAPGLLNEAPAEHLGPSSGQAFPY